MIHDHIGELAALAVSFCWTITAIAFESASKRIGSLAVNIIRLIMAFIFLSAFNMVQRGFLFPADAGAHQWIWLSISGLIGFVLGDLFLFKAFTVIGSRLSMLIMTLAPPITAVAGFAFLHERLTFFNLLGIAITFAGIFMTIFGEPGSESLKLRMPLKGFLFALGGTFGQAFGLIFSKKGIENYDPFAATQIRVIAGIAGFIVLTLFMKRHRQVLKAITNKPAMLATATGSFFGPFLGVSFSLLAVQYTKTGIASTLMSLIPVIIIAPSVLIFKQKVTIREIIGAVISVIGVAMFFV